MPAIAGFLAKARSELGPTGVFLAADVFGYTAFNDNDTDIGQRIEDIAPHLDYFSPMVYPSGYHMGIPGVRNPVSHSLRDRQGERAADSQALGEDAGRRSGRGSRTSGTTPSTSASSASARSSAQVRGADDGGRHRLDALESPSNDYTAAALRPRRPPWRRSRRPAVTRFAPLAVALAAVLAALGPGRRAPATRPANELGRVMILEYHKIDLPEERWTRTPDNFRRDLQRLWERGYRLVASTTTSTAGSRCRGAPRP